jgi:type II secretory pathway pseudopilin PulG
MQRRSREAGAALIMLLGIMAALAIMAVMLVTVLANQQSATAQQRNRSSSVGYAEGAMDAVVQAAKTASAMPTASPSAAGVGWLGDSAALSSITSGLGFPAGTTVQAWIYDNLTTVNKGTYWDSNHDGMMWVEVLAVTPPPKSRKSRVRVLVRSGTASIVSGLPRAVVYADTGITLLGTSNLYAVKDDGSAIVEDAGAVTSVMCGTYFNASGDASATLIGPGSSVRAVGTLANTSITPTSLGTPAANSVGLLSDYFDQSEQADLADEAQAGNNMALYDANPNPAPAPNPTPTTLAQLKADMTRTGTGTYTYTASGDLIYKGDLTLGDGNIYKFQKLFVNGNLNITGNTHVDTTALRVGTPYEATSHTITISGATTDTNDHFGPIYATGDLIASGAADILTTDYTKANADPTASVPPDQQIDGVSNNAPGPLWVRRLQITLDAGSVIALGDTWVNGFDDSNNSTLFAGPASGTAVQVWCPLLATTEQTSFTGLVNYGSISQPMSFYMQCDNDGGYYNTCNMSTQGTFYGLMVLMEARIEFSGSSTQPVLMGAVFEGAPAPTYTPPYNNSFYNDIPTGDDITLRGTSRIAYNQKVIDGCINKSITTTTTTVQIVPGSWQQLSVN